MVTQRQRKTKLTRDMAAKLSAPPANPRMTRDEIPFGDALDLQPYQAGKIVWMVQNAAPPKPACFDTERIWRDWLILLHFSGEKITRRQDVTVDDQRVVTRVFAAIDYCQDCTPKRAAKMLAEGRCTNPNPPTQEEPR